MPAIVNRSQLKGVQLAPMASQVAPLSLDNHSIKPIDENGAKTEEKTGETRSGEAGSKSKAQGSGNKKYSAINHPRRPMKRKNAVLYTEDAAVKVTSTCFETQV